MSTSDYEPRRKSTVWTALRRHWVVALSIFLGTSIAGAGAGFLVPLEYVAQSRVIAGTTSVSTSAVNSYAQAGLALAETYSRVFRGDAVIQRMVETLGYTDFEAEASPIAGSSVIVIEARGSTPDQALAVANAGADALVSTSVDLLVLNNDEVLSSAEAALETAYSRQLSAEDAVAAILADPAATEDELKAAQSELAVAQVAVNAQNLLIQDLVRDRARSNGLTQLMSAELTSDNELRRFALTGGLGVIVGAVVACIVAYVLPARRVAKKRYDPR